MDEIGLYLHIPFCRARCSYCDFHTWAGLEPLFDDYTTALALEIDKAGPARARTLFIGGGTPTVLPLSHLERVLAAARRASSLEAGAEISLEANPSTIDRDKLAGLRALGVNRLSLGVQSFDDGELRILGRIHDPAQAAGAFRAARQAGFDNINLDLIYGLPGQPLAAWQRSLDQALALRPEHLSLYALSVEEGTPLAVAIERGNLPDPDPDLAAEMYECAQETLSAAGYVHYEISNWAARPELVCRHNLIYWRNEPYLGLGAAAHSWHDGRRRANVAHPADYMARVLGGEQPTDTEETIGSDLEMGETMMLGLRLLEEGVGLACFQARFGQDLRQRFVTEIAELSALNLIEIDDRRIRLSARGRLLGNQVFFRFLPG